MRMALALAVALLPLGGAVQDQIDPARAQRYFDEVEAICEREGGAMWGISLVGPIVIADPLTREIVTSRPEPDAPRPQMLGFANAAMPWGEERWCTLVWQTLPHDDDRARQQMIMHELFHRIQFELDLMTPDGSNDHLDTPDGRYWLQLEWRALSEALAAKEDDRARAISDALAFRAARRAQFDGAGEQERREEIREGLAQYTGILAVCGNLEDAAADVRKQLALYASEPTYVRTFAYPSGAAYGVLLDCYSDDWRRRVSAGDDLGALLMDVAAVIPSDNPAHIAEAYGGGSVRLAERAREQAQLARLAELRHLFVDGPVLVLPGDAGSFRTAGVTALPGAGTVYPGVRVTAEWGTLVAEWALRSEDRKQLIVPSPTGTEGMFLSGPGWTLEVANGWRVVKGDRDGDYLLVQNDQD